MANDFTIPSLGGATAADDPKATKKTDKNKGQVNKEEFLNLLVHQLQNQDPLDPMKSEEFAVQLATFSQLEQLIEINGKLGDSGGAGSAGSMASYLGQQVVLKDETPVSVSGGKGPDLMVDMPQGARSARVDFLDDKGVVQGSVVVPDVLEGKQAISLEGANVPNGDYSVRVVAVSGTGQFVDVDAKVTGVVEGFVLDPEAALLVGGKPVTLDNVTEVSKPLQKAS